MKPAKLIVVVMLWVAVSVSAHQPVLAATIIRARVAPVREIVVDNDGKITRIDSNTTEDVVPTVRRGTVTGPIIILTPAIATEYNSLKSRISFVRAGVVYRRPSQSVSWLARQWQRLRRLSIVPTRA